MLIPSFPRTRRGGVPFAGLLLLMAAGAGLEAQTLSPVNDGFNPSPNGVVNSVVVQSDGKILVGGYFTQFHPDGNPIVSRNYIARLNHDGSVDSGFSPSANGVVRAIALQPSGQILVAGEFTTMQPTGGTSPVARNYAARLNPDGTLDTAFNPNANAIVYAMAYQPDGKILIGGAFTTVQPPGSPAPVARNRIARFNADGTLDASFDPNADRTVLALAVLPTGQIVVGGGFSKLQPNGSATATTRNCVARLNSDGSLDTGFDPNANGSVMAIAPLPSGQIIIAGQFTTLQPDGASGTTQVDFLARVNTDGTLDTSYLINPLGYVSGVAVQGDGSIIIVGNFTSVFAANSAAATSIGYAARITPDGSVDTSFYTNPSQAASAVAIQSDGEVILGGYFTTIQGIPRYCLARVQADGSVDGTLAPDNQGSILASVDLSSGQRLVGGSFTSMGGVTQSYLARINADGSIDTSFAPTVNGTVETIALQSDGKILLGGTFTEIDGIARGYIARMNPDGTLDGPFNPNANASVALIVPQKGGQMLVSGSFSEFIPNGSTVATGIPSFARLNSGGTVDDTFVPNPSGTVFAVATQADGKIVIAGTFTSVDGVGRGYVARITSSGALDTVFDPEANLPVFALAIQSDGKILIGGSFTAVEPQILGKSGTPTVVKGPYGTITVPQPGTSATTPIYINHLARLNTDGTLDTTYFPDPSAIVLALALQSDGRLLVGGSFTSFDPNGNPAGTIRNYIGRVNTDGSIDPSFDPSANGYVDYVELLPSGNILVAGNFTSLQPNGAPAPTAATHIAILNPDGSINPSFTGSAISGASGQVTVAALEPNGIVLVGGTFGPFYGAPGPYMTSFTANGQATGLNPYLNGPVNAISVLPGGALTGTTSNYAVWLEANGTVRHTFSASSNGQVITAVQQPDGKVLVGGAFTGLAGSSTTQYLVRLNGDGTVDTSFNPTLDGEVYAILLQTDGKIVIGGSFSNILGGTSISYLARLNPDGTLDTAFQPAPNLSVTTLALQSDGKILVGGNFTSMETAQTAATTTRNYVARINPDGSLDTSFNPDPNGVPSTFIVLSNGQILMCGNFSSVDPNFGSTTSVYGSMVRLNSDGTLDTKFNPGPNGPVDAMVMQSDGKIVVGGAFTEFTPNSGTTTSTLPSITTGSLARINTDGSIDTTFKPTPNSEVSAIDILPNGQIMVGGSFTGFQPNGAAYSTPRLFLARLNSDGTVDPAFDTELNSGANVILTLQDGSFFVGGAFTAVDVGGAMFIGGSFTTIGGTSAPYLARLNADSTVDSTFSANSDGAVFALVPQVDGSLIVGGAFAHVGALPRSNIARLTGAGLLDTAFNPNANSAVDAVALQQDGRIVLGGAFTAVGGQAVTYLARVSATGVPDASFAPLINGPVSTVVVQQNGQIVIGGSFTSVAGQSVNRIARLNSDGSLDAGFNPNASGPVAALSLLSDGTLIAGGSFTTMGGQATPYVAHIGTNGSVDTTFVPNPNAPVSAVLVQKDGKVFLGGSFTSVGGVSRYEIARLSVPTAVEQILTASSDESTITWARTGPAPAFSSVKFEESTDGTHWTSVGQATQVSPSTWQLSGAASAGTTTFMLRATGIEPSSAYSSSGVVQQVQAINTQAIPVITSAGQVSSGSGAPFSFTVTGTQLPTYYSASGLPPGLTINSSTGVISGTPTGSGTYTVTVSAGNASGISSSTLVIAIGVNQVTPYTPAAGSSSDRLLNLSCRAELSGSSTLIAGFVVSGTTQKTVLLRAVGPGLAAFSVPGFMATPELQLYSNSGALIAQNSAWGGSGSLSAVMAQVGAFPLAPGSADSALVTNLAPGAYTIHVSDSSGKGGVVLTEIYDASASLLTDTSRLVNISAQGGVSSGAGALIGGFVVSGSSTKSVIIRGVGPGLATFGVAGWLADPVLSVYDSSDTLVAQNRSWSSQAVAGPYQAAVGPGNIINLDAIVGAFALSTGDAAAVADLPPGSYTFQITSASGSTGRALGEVYELP